MTDVTARIKTIQMELAIEAPIDVVWEALTSRIGDWWPDEFYAGGSEVKRKFLLDAEPGGRMYEKWEEGGGVLWGTVVAIEPENTLQVLGHSFPNRGGPSQWYGTWKLTPGEKYTTLVFSESALGHLTDDGMKEKDKGWQYLWATLKAHVERSASPAWPEK